MTHCEISDWCKAKDINWIICSPYNPALNGKAESAVKIMKSLLKKMRGNSMVLSEVLLVYCDTLLGPNLPTLAQLMNGDCLWMELPTENLSSDYNVKLPEKWF